jgi:competence protein ComEC
MNGALLKSIHTRFRAFSLGTEGASYSIFTGDHFTLIEARATEKSIPSIVAELRDCGRSSIDTLHITSWDMDHCNLAEMAYILERWAPRRIEYPGYEADKDNGKACLQLISDYKARQASRGTPVTCQMMSPAYIGGLNTAEALSYRDVVYHPKVIYEGSNNNSTVKMFRKGSFNVASLGDVEHENIGAYLRRDRIFNSELDVLIVPHHGAENPIMTRNFMSEVEPQLAVCSNDYDDKFDHPDESVRDLFEEFGVELLCTKTGDILVESVTDAQFGALNVHGSQVFPKGPYTAKKARLLRGTNLDSLRNLHHPGYRPKIIR